MKLVLPPGTSGKTFNRSLSAFAAMAVFPDADMKRRAAPSFKMPSRSWSRK